MAPRTKQIFSWAGISILLTVLTISVKIAWGTSGRFTSIEDSNTDQDQDIVCLELSQDQTDDELSTLRARIEVLEEWKIITDARFDNELDIIRTDVRDIRNYLMGERQ